MKSLEGVVNIYKLFFLNLYRNSSERCLLCYRHRREEWQPFKRGKKLNSDSAPCYLFYGTKATFLCMERRRGVQAYVYMLISNVILISNRSNYMDIKQISVCQGLEEERG